MKLVAKKAEYFFFNNFQRQLKLPVVKVELSWVESWLQSHRQLLKSSTVIPPLLFLHYQSVLLTEMCFTIFNPTSGTVATAVTAATTTRAINSRDRLVCHKTHAAGWLVGCPPAGIWHLKSMPTATGIYHIHTHRINRQTYHMVELPGWLLTVDVCNHVWRQVMWTILNTFPPMHTSHLSCMKW